jgi:hypothetical protein
MTLTLVVGSLGRSDRLFTMTSKWHTPVKNILNCSRKRWGRVNSVIRDKFSVVLYLVRVVHKFDSRPFTKWTRNKWRPVKSVRDMFLTRSVCFLCRHLRETMDPPNPHCQGQSSIPEQRSVSKTYTPQWFRISPRKVKQFSHYIFNSDIYDLKSSKCLSKMQQCVSIVTESSEQLSPSFSSPAFHFSYLLFVHLTMNPLRFILPILLCWIFIAQTLLQNSNIYFSFICHFSVR